MNRCTLTTLICLLLCTASLQAADYYWVGGSGDWSDISHWATTPGGTTFHNQAPTADDNVFFDENSFTGPGQTVFLNAENAFCRSMDWSAATNAPTFEGPADHVLNLFGSLVLHPDMTFDLAGDIRFSANELNMDIDLAGKSLQRNAFFTGAGGSWSLLSGFRVDSLLQFNEGQFFSNDFPIICEFFAVESFNPSHQVDFGDSRVLITGVDYIDPFNPNIIIPVFRLQSLSGTYDFSETSFELQGGRVTARINPGNLDITIDSLYFSSPLGKSFVQRQDAVPGPRINTLHIQNNGEINAGFDVGVLHLGAGKTHFLPVGNPNAIQVEELQMNGNCTAPIQLFSMTPGQTAFLTTANTLTGSFASIRDVQINGGGSGMVSDGANLGNTMGWNITPKPNTDLYWVGGTGMWDDAANWSFSSGGPGGACIPSAGDNVIFDGNSFGGVNDVVMLNVEDAYCNSMQWTGVTGDPVLMGASDVRLHIFGSLQLAQNMQQNFEGDIYFESNFPGNTITMAEQTAQRAVYFNGQGGWTLQDSLQMDAGLYFSAGNLNTNDQYLRCSGFYGTTAQERTLTLGASLLEIVNVNYTDFRLNSDNLILDAGSSTIRARTGLYIEFSGQEGLTLNRMELLSAGDFTVTEKDKPFNNTFIRYLDLNYFTYFFQTLKIDTLNPAMGYTHYFPTQDTVFIDEVEQTDDCSFQAEFRSYRDDLVSYIGSPNDQLLSNVIVKDVHVVGGAIWTGQQSVDLGNSTGWEFILRSGRTLYWVGDGGEWHDRAHWSLSSGGPGGECVPTPIDDVIFDANSFTMPNQLVTTYSGGSAYCRDLTWDNTTNQPRFSVFTLNIFGSLNLQDDMDADLFDLYMRSEVTGKEIRVADKYISYLTFQGSGSWDQRDSISVFVLLHENGDFHTNGNPVAFEGLNIFTEQPKLFDIEGSTIHYDNQYEFFDIFINPGNNSLTIEAANSTILAKSVFPRMFVYSSGHVFDRIISTNTAGNIRLEGQLNASYVELNNDGILDLLSDAQNIDSLIFSPGKSYQMGTRSEIVMNDYFQSLGNNCTPIEILSLNPGTQSIFRMDDGLVKSDFVQMRDQRAVGSTTDFLAGVHSTDIANSNTGWIFESAPEFRDEGFLGSDQVQCQGQTVALDATNNAPGETYLWQDGSTEATFTTDQPGIYWAEVTFTNSCVIRDSVVVLPPEDFAAMLPADTTLCEGDSLLLDPNLDLIGLTYEWQDASQDSTFLVTTAGDYKVTLQLSGCTSADSLQVDYQAYPDVDLGADRSLCPDETTTLDATSSGASYEWQDGSTTPTYDVNTPGLYIATVTLQGCSSSDTVTIDYFAPINLDLGPDTAICEASTLLLDASIYNGDAYDWTTGSSEAAIQVGNAGTYGLQVTRNGCTASDSLNVSIKPLPRFELGPDTAICEESSLQLDGTVDATTSYEWQDGLTVATRNVSSEAIYVLTATRDGCSFFDSIAVEVIPLPRIDLGEQRTACEGEVVLLNAMAADASYTWQDGSTDATYQVSDAGEYTVELNRRGCLFRDSVQVRFDPLPRIDVGPDTTICAGTTVSLTANTDGDAFQWSDGTSSPQLSIATPGIYWLEATLDNCTDRDSMELTVIDLPEEFLGDDEVLCDGTVKVLEAPVFSGASYQWQDGSTRSQFEVSEPGIYSVEVELGPCRTNDAIEIVYNPVPRFELGPDTTLCAGQELSLNVAVDADLISWQDGSTGRIYRSSVDGTIVATADLNQCSWSDSLRLTIQALPQLELGPDTTVCEDEGYQLTANVSGQRYEWQDGRSSRSINVTEPGLYQLTLTDRACTIVDAVQVDFRRCFRFRTFIPTAFSPNNDGRNETFTPNFPPTLQIRSFAMKIFDRWGMLMYSSTDPTDGWDGTINGGDLAPQGAYIYQIEIDYQDDFLSDQEVIAGDLLLIR